MSEFDRLSSLINRFTLQVTPTLAAPVNLVILQDIQTGQPSQIMLAPLSHLPKLKLVGECVMFSARTAWGRNNPLFSSLPDLIKVNIHGNSHLTELARLIKIESDAQCCGLRGVLNRLGEVLIISIFRQQIEMGTNAPGLLNVLADRRLSKAIVSMHDAPGKLWSNENLADLAGLSRSRFTQLFNQQMGQTAQSYLRHWRMILASQDIERGDRIQTIATRYGYGSSEALGRAFQQQFGTNPIAHRRSL